MNTKRVKNQSNIPAERKQSAVAEPITIDLDFRPVTYWPEETDRLRRLVSRIKGVERRREALARLETGQLCKVEDWMVEADIGLETKQTLWRRSPDWWGGPSYPGLLAGEDLPDLKSNEVEIARLQFTQTIHREVVSVRARMSGDRIRYRIVNEYWDNGPDWQIATTIHSSKRPLTLGRVVTLIDTAQLMAWDKIGLIKPEWEFWAESDEPSPEAVRDDIAVSSECYPQLYAWYDHAFDEWCARVRASLPPEEDEEDAGFL